MGRESRHRGGPAPWMDTLLGAYDMGKMAELANGTIPGLEMKIKEAEAKVQQVEGERLLKEEVDEEDVA